MPKATNNENSDAIAQDAAQRLLRKQSNHAMSRFVSKERQLPKKRTPEKRRADFSEIYTEFDNNKAEDQSARCSQCGIPFCQLACPLYNNIPDWLLLAAAGRWYEAYQCSSATNPMPEICGRICPQDRLCEGDCVIEQSDHGAVTIGAVEAYITDKAWQEGWIVAPVILDNQDMSIGIIGSGPAGLAAAESLRKQGYDVVIYESSDRAGGLLTYGIPNFKLDKSIISKRLELLEEMGIQFELNCRIGVDLSFADCRKRHDAVLISTGVYQARQSGCLWPKEGVIAALPYLIASNRRNFNDTLSPEVESATQMKDQRVLVIGGGDTAMDCVRTAIRQGAKTVTCVYRRDKDNMPGSRRELDHAIEENVQFSWLMSPKTFISHNNKLTALEASHMRVVKSFGVDRLPVTESEEDPTVIPCDRIIAALGFTPDPLRELFNASDLEVDDWGQIKTNGSHGQTSLPGVFAAGDIVRGASLVVWAIREGLDTARGIHNYLSNKKQKVA